MIQIRILFDKPATTAIPKRMGGNTRAVPKSPCNDNQDERQSRKEAHAQELAAGQATFAGAGEIACQDQYQADLADFGSLHIDSYVQPSFGSHAPQLRTEEQL
ncbi:MAG: hypothetical protein ACRD1R_08420 [Acidobacteriota bacterium]